MILIFPPGIATSSVGAASNIGTSLIEKVPLQIQSCKNACYFVFINTHIAFFVFLIGNKIKDALNYYASSITTPSSSNIIHMVRSSADDNTDSHYLWLLLSSSESPHQMPTPSNPGRWWTADRWRSWTQRLVEIENLSRSWRARCDLVGGHVMIGDGDTEIDCDNMTESRLRSCPAR